MKLFIPIILFVFLLSCKKADNKIEHTVLNINKSLTINTKNIYLNDIAQEINIIPVETNDSTLFKHLFIAGVTKSKIISFDKDALYSIEKDGGFVKKILNNQGSGATEYKYIIDVILDSDSSINIYDSGKRGFLKYDFQGNFVCFFRSDTITTYQKLQDGNYYVCYSPFLKTNRHTGVYDKNWTFLRKGINNNRKGIDFDMYFWNEIKKYNEKLFFKDVFCDTIYNVTTEQDIPYIILSKGKYKVPLEIASNMEKGEKDGHKYIQSEDYKIASKYCFLTYYYDHNKYYDIWDIETSELIFRNIFNGKKKSSGIPIKINNSIIHIWANYAEDNIIYCVIDTEDALKLLPALPNDTNPILLEVKLK